MDSIRFNWSGRSALSTSVQMMLGRTVKQQTRWVKGSIRVNGKPSFVTETGVELPLKSAPSGATERRCVYGIRPEHLTLAEGDFRAEISVVEPTGSETQVFAKLGGQQIVGVFRERISARPGDSLPLSPNLEAVHLFDAETGKRLE